MTAGTERGSRASTRQGAPPCVRGGAWRRGRRNDSNMGSSLEVSKGTRGGGGAGPVLPGGSSTPEVREDEGLRGGAGGRITPGMACDSAARERRWEAR